MLDDMLLAFWVASLVVGLCGLSSLCVLSSYVLADDHANDAPVLAHMAEWHGREAQPW